MESQFSNFPVRILEREFFPKNLLKLSKPPERIYYRGKLPDFGNSWIAMVGTRRPGPNAEDICRALVFNLKETDAVVVSGLAQGIDSFCHEAAIRSGISTVAVIAQGIEADIGGSRLALAHRILQNGGAVVSEYAGKTPPLKFMFPARNRIIAGLCKSTTLVESKASGGGMLTVRFAQKLKRQILCVPGNFLFETSQGPNRLIAQKEASPVWFPENYPDLCGARRLSDPKPEDLFQTGIRLGENAKKLFREHAGFTYTLEALKERSRFPIPELLAILTELEIAGFVISKDGYEFHFLTAESS